jgi:peptidoglycan/LPS O-acetylase OafA/YrhL
LKRPAWVVGHAWSLSIEEHFYLMWPLALAWGGGAFGRRAASIAVAFCFTARWAVLLVAPRFSAMAELWTFTRLDSIALGCLLAILSRDGAWRARLDRWARPAAVAALGAALACSLAAWGLSTKYRVGVAYTVDAALIALLVWASVRGAGSRVGALLNHPAVVSVGVRSYSIYLWQQVFLNAGSASFVCRFPQNVAFSVLLGAASYHCVEKPFLTLKGRLGAPAARRAPDAEFGAAAGSAAIGLGNMAS